MELITVKISDIGEVIGGGTPSTSNPDYWNGNIPWISPKDLTNNKSVYITCGENFITKLGLNKSGTRLLPQNTILLSSRAPIGYLAIAKNPICTNQGFKNIVCKYDIVEPLYLYYFLKINIDYIKSFASGATFPEISGSTLRKIKINIFSNVNYQRRIASILRAYDNLIENNERRIHQLEQMAENLYKEWFVRYRFPGYETAEFENGLPKGWKATNLSEIGTFKRGKNITANEMVEGNIPVISAGIEPSGKHNCANVKGISVTISSSGANAGYISIHYSDIWAADCSYIDSKTSKYIFFAYEMLNCIRIIITNLQRGAAQPHVYPKDVNKIRVFIPTQDLIKKANLIFEVFHNRISNLQKQNRLLARERDLLLPRLMSGKLEVE